MSVTHYTPAKLNEFIKELRDLYDVVRVVDPYECRELLIEDGGSVDFGKSCFSVWGYVNRCENCTSYAACRTRERCYKEGILDGDVYNVQSFPVVLDLSDSEQRECVLEILTKKDTSNDILTGIISRYSLIYEINLETDFITVVYETPDNGTFGMMRQGRYSEFNQRYAAQKLPNYKKLSSPSGSSVDGLRELLKDKDSAHYEYTNNMGRKRVLEYRVSSRKNGVPTKVLLCLKKIREDNMELSELREERDRSRELLEIALQEARQANAAKTTFLSNMSHDIRTPMNAVIGYATLAHASIGDDAMVADYLEKISASGKYMLELVNNVLDLVRIESGRYRVLQQPNDLRIIMEDLRSMFCEQAKSKQQTFICDSSGISESKVYCDEIKLKQVLSNLIQNAINYTPQGGRVEFIINESLSDLDNYGNYEVIVRDSGIGMSAEFQQRMYEPFEREEKSTTSGVPGNGLGLSIIKRLVEIGGGSIEVKSEPGQGTEFKINLEFRHQTTSLMAGSGSRKSGRRNRAAAPTFDMSTFAGKRFLIVEDSRMNRAILSEFLKRSGGESDTAENGRIAVDLIDEKPAGYYACILMDAQMPTMNGYEAAKAIRRMEDSDKSGIPIICISANAFKEDREAAKAAGMDDYLEKPIDVNKLIEKMLKLIG